MVFSGFAAGGQGGGQGPYRTGVQLVGTMCMGPRAAAVLGAADELLAEGAQRAGLGADLVELSAGHRAVTPRQRLLRSSTPPAVIIAKPICLRRTQARSGVRIGPCSLHPRVYSRSADSIVIALIAPRSRQRADPVRRTGPFSLCGRC